MAAAVLFDIDGVLAVSWEPLPGAVRRVQGSGRPIGLVTVSAGGCVGHDAFFA
jgi:ribonucleotide monophosphatase NagD (HAD superfamily)